MIACVICDLYSKTLTLRSAGRQDQIREAGSRYGDTKLHQDLHRL